MRLKDILLLTILGAFYALLYIGRSSLKSNYALTWCIQIEVATYLHWKWGLCWDVSCILYDFKCNCNAFLLPILKVVEFARRTMINTCCYCVILVNSIIILVAWIHLLQGCQGRPRTVTGKSAVDVFVLCYLCTLGHKHE